QVMAQTAPAIAALCDGLEGIPLAIELAAARAQTLSPAQMVAQLTRRFDFLVTRKRDVVDRHRTLHAAIDWSYRSLLPEEQQLFPRLSVFRGGWTLEAAEAVYGTGTHEVGGGVWEYGSPEGPDHSHTPTLPHSHTDPLDQLAQLQECSLVLA